MRERDYEREQTMSEISPTGAAAGDRRDADPTDGRDETEAERLDRNWSELLQELRVIQTGAQILTGFLLTAVFQSRFGTLDSYQLTVYLVLVIASILTTVFGLAPVSLHRTLFRHRAKHTIVDSTDRFLQITMVGVALTLAGTGMLIFDFVFGRMWGVAVGVLILALIGLVWIVVPRRLRARIAPPPALGQE